MSNNIQTYKNKKELYKITNTKKFTNKFSFTNGLLLTLPYFSLTILLVIVPLVVIIVNAFLPSTGNIDDNFGIMTGTIWNKIGKSIYVSIISTIFILLISFPFAYLLSLSKNKIWKTLIMLVITAPVWVNMLVKLIGIKTIFDVINGSMNSTYGDIYTILGLTYLYTPFMIIPLYNSLDTIPKNLINASKDLGRNNFQTFFYVVVPWCKSALISGVVLVLLPCFTSVAVPSFLNNNNDSGLIGDVIINQGENGLSSSIALSRTSVLVLVVSAFTLVIYGSIVLSPKIYSWSKKIINTRNRGKNNE